MINRILPWYKESQNNILIGTFSPQKLSNKKEYWNPLLSASLFSTSATSETFSDVVNVRETRGIFEVFFKRTLSSVLQRGGPASFLGSHARSESARTLPGTRGISFFFLFFFAITRWRVARDRTRVCFVKCLKTAEGRKFTAVKRAMAKPRRAYKRQRRVRHDTLAIIAFLPSSPLSFFCFFFFFFF